MPSGTLALQTSSFTEESRPKCEHGSPMAWPSHVSLACATALPGAALRYAQLSIILQVIQHHFATTAPCALPRTCEQDDDHTSSTVAHIVPDFERLPADTGLNTVGIRPSMEIHGARFPCGMEERGKEFPQESWATRPEEKRKARDQGYIPVAATLG